MVGSRKRGRFEPYKAGKEWARKWGEKRQIGTYLCKTLKQGV